MRALASVVLTLEAVVVALAVPVAVVLSDVSAPLAVTAGALLVTACLATVALLRFPWAYRLGWAVQAAVLLSGLVVPVMFFLGGVFLVLWGIALRLGSQAGRRPAAAGRRSDNPVEPGQG